MLQEKLKKLREDWHFVKNRGQLAASEELATKSAISSPRKEGEYKNLINNKMNIFEISLFF